ncbi:S24 family peptidase [Guyparkeria halopsychrophila]|uniref:S24 family peptidase n=1 Tax=Guyparkeria halopsychrophila TaxID=3139421 RepID=UPI0037C57706
MSLGKNIRTLRKTYGWSQQTLSDKTGGAVSQGAIAALESRDSKKSEHAKPIAAAFGVDVADLVYRDIQPGWCPALDQGQPVNGRHPEDGDDPDEVQVREYRITFAGGHGAVFAYETVEESEPATYRLSWMQRQHLKADDLRRFRVCGESMEPTLYDGDVVLVNTAENDPAHIMDGRVYAIRYGDELRVKRLFRKLDGTLVLRSDNQAFEDEEVPPALADEHISIIGRVRDKSGPGGL